METSRGRTICPICKVAIDKNHFCDCDKKEVVKKENKKKEEKNDL